jgi:hypothetical protein
MVATLHVPHREALTVAQRSVADMCELRGWLPAYVEERKREGPCARCLVMTRAGRKLRIAQDGSIFATVEGVS